MRCLTVLYDESCGLCSRAGSWLQEQPSFVPLVFLPAGGPRARRLFPGVSEEETRRELCVIADDGRLWKGAGAWILCLWALRRYRGWALEIARPGRLELARRFVSTVSQNRYRLSDFLPTPHDA